MNHPIDVSRAVVASTRFLREVYVQVAALGETLDREMQRSGWRSTRSGDTGAGLSNRIRKPLTWIPSLISRVYSPTDGQPDVAIVTIAILEAEGVGGALLLTAALKLAEPLGAEELFGRWKSSDSLLPVLSMLEAEPETWLDLPEEAREDESLWSRPLSARVRVLDLALVSGEEALQSKVIEPVLKEAARLRESK